MTDSDLPLGALGATMGLRLIEVSADRAVGTLPVEGNTQPYGILHGGASCVLAEQLGTSAAMAHAGAGRIAVGVELNASHHRSVADGLITGVATAITLGRTLASYEIVITDDQERRVCTARLTCVVRDVLQP
jgi:1,4-dihydroxy-2-naphthoyl-CoA hydrolase